MSSIPYNLCLNFPVLQVTSFSTFSRNFVVSIICGCLQISDTLHFENAHHCQSPFPYGRKYTHTHSLAARVLIGDVTAILLVQVEQRLYGGLGDDRGWSEFLSRSFLIMADLLWFGVHQNQLCPCLAILQEFSGNCSSKFRYD